MKHSEILEEAIHWINKSRYDSWSGADKETSKQGLIYLKSHIDDMLSTIEDREEEEKDDTW